MTSLLRLDVPVPLENVQFERLFFGSIDRLLRLSAARRRAAETTAAVVRVLDADETSLRAAKEALEHYEGLWTAALRDLEGEGARARARLPLEFAWRWAALIDESGRRADGEWTTHVSASPSLESVAVAVARAAVEQRLAAHEPAAAERARLALVRLADEQLPVAARPLLHSPPERPPGPTTPSVVRETRARAREPVLLSPTRLRALADAVAAQQHCRSAVAAAGSAAPPAQVAAHFFVGARAFRRALERLPAEAALRRSAARASALAYRYAAAGLVDGARHEAGGAAVALARQARAADPANTTLDAFARELERRNELEFGMQRVPADVRVVFAPRADAPPSVDLRADGAVCVRM